MIIIFILGSIAMMLELLRHHLEVLKCLGKEENGKSFIRTPDYYSIMESFKSLLHIAQLVSREEAGNTLTLGNWTFFIHLLVFTNIVFTNICYWSIVVHSNLIDADTEEAIEGPFK